MVHENHGLGIYRGIEKVEIDNAVKDYIKIEYNGSNLYILATQLDMLQKYASREADGPKPKLSASTVIPQARAAKAWPNSWTRIMIPMPRKPIRMERMLDQVKLILPLCSAGGP